MLRRVKIALSLLLLLVVGLCWLLSHNSHLRRENETFSARIAELKQISVKNERQVELRLVTAEVEELRRANKDLYKLRNEIAQLRRQKQELEGANRALEMKNQ